MKKTSQYASGSWGYVVAQNALEALRVVEDETGAIADHHQIGRTLHVVFEAEQPCTPGCPVCTLGDDS